MVYLYRGNLYLDKSHVSVLKPAPDYIKIRYNAMIYCLSRLAGHSLQQVADLIGVSKRTIQRWKKAYLEDGIDGLLKKSTRPKTFPNKTDDRTEHQIEVIRNNTGSSPGFIRQLLNMSITNGARSRNVSRTTVYNILVRRGVIEQEKRNKPKWRFFEWARPKQLIQTDLTEFRSMPIMTSLDDHSRFAWAKRITAEDVNSVVKAMEDTMPESFENMLSDNGMIYKSTCAEMRKYVEKHVLEKHIHTSNHHPQTMGKLAVFQNKLKKYLNHVVPIECNDFCKIDRLIKLFLKVYNNAWTNSRTQSKPAERYMGVVDESWYDEFIDMFKLEDVLQKTGGDITP